MKQPANLLGVIKTIFKYKWTILVLCAMTFVGTAFISLLLPNYFKATTIFFAASEDLAKPESLFTELGSNIRTEYYGSESDIDRLMTVAHSNELKDFLIDTFNLYQHYKINPAVPKAKYRARLKVNKYYDIIKTDRDALELSFEDKDPAFAAQVANAARNKIENIALQLIRSNQSKSLRANENNVTDKNKLLQVLADSLAVLRKTYGIYDGIEQTQDLGGLISATQNKLTYDNARLSQYRKMASRAGIQDSIAYLEAKVEGLGVTLDTLASKMALWQEGLAAVMDTEKQYFDLAQRLSGDRERTRILQATYVADVPAVLLVEKAEIPLYKSRPKRSILVLAATFLMFCFMILGVVVFENYKEVDWKSIVNA
jgi:uncharacterized protein involved in exopolysaccharide biosynthesis